MADAERKASFWPVLLASVIGGLISAGTSFGVTYFQLARQQSFEREMTTMATLKSYTAVYAKGSSQLTAHVAQLAPVVGKLAEQSSPTYEATLDAAKQYEQVATELNQWLGQVGRELTMLEVLTGRKAPNVSFTTAWGLPGFVDRLNSAKRKDVVLLLRQQTTQMQADLIAYIQASNSFLESVSKSLTH